MHPMDVVATPDHTLGGQLTALARLIVDPTREVADLQRAVAQLAALLRAHTSLAFDASSAAVATTLPQGVALAPLTAARCIDDFVRTARFLQGVYAAIQAAQARFSPDCVEVLYAGSGPLAPLALPLMGLFAPEHVQFTIIDIHPESIRSVAQLLDRCGYRPYVRALVVADATTYEHPAAHSLHVVIIETMQRALTKEPQVALTRQLARQLIPGGMLIPEAITISACLVDLQREFSLASTAEALLLPRLRVELGPVFQLSRATWFNDPRSMETTIRIPDHDQPSATRVMLCTRIVVYDPICLGDYDSGITYPLLLLDLGTPAVGTTIHFRYQFGPMPGLVYWPAEG